MLQKRIPASSTEFLHLDFDVAPGNITTLPVQMAITVYPRGPVSGDWVDAAWTPGAAPPASRILIGPDSARPLARATYCVWGRVTAAPELPVVEAPWVLTVT
ncbi:hypothetical protein Ssi03_50670 [Sphaerisporangium siamense]|uniref:Uncharacterized protein n=1 Tax=Sphaerisporangium siamense TaxID=795645 RepID=A0A7W7D914_9ACTN|nr:hypothetical protein [Sphaerisporangium siamense]MBB4702229.1 hypothetical protein [Sphaerisporangium siamense]GII87077.1 hypothetical protein Ssi03_50670 [Sphaerisporangium siamense]